MMRPGRFSPSTPVVIESVGATNPARKLQIRGRVWAIRLNAIALPANTDLFAEIIGPSGNVLARLQLTQIPAAGFASTDTVYVDQNWDIAEVNLQVAGATLLQLWIYMKEDN